MTTPPNPHPHEEHKSQRSNWLRAAVLGVNDGIVSVSSIMLGVLAASASHATILTSGVAALAAGALSMAMGEYVSVSSQKDSEQADIDIESRSLATNPDGELAELTHIYVERGLDEQLAQQVAQQLHDHDAVAAHARDELGIDHEDLANPAQAAAASAVSFSIGAIVYSRGARRNGWSQRLGHRGCLARSVGRLGRRRCHIVEPRELEFLARTFGDDAVLPRRCVKCRRVRRTVRDVN